MRDIEQEIPCARHPGGCSPLPLARGALSLDAPLSAKEGVSLLDYLPDEDAAPSDAGAIDVALASSVNDAVSRLRPRERTAVRLYFGFDVDRPMTLEAIGARLGVTGERARQIKDRALSSLRKSAGSRTLATFDQP